MKHQKLKSVLLYFPFLLLHCCISPAISLTEDAEILLHVKANQLEDPNGRLNGWIPTDLNGPCDWSGITCDTKNGSVISIDLSSFGISGEFPSGFCRIPTLRRLSVSDNFLNGSISLESMSHCSHLHFMNLSENIFVGSLPEFTPHFVNLHTLDLAVNNFSADIPESFGRFPVLRVLKLSGNFINGSVPEFLTNLTELTDLELGYNPFKRGRLPSGIGNLTKLKTLWLASSNLVGNIPGSIGNLVELRNLDLSNNFLSGEIPNSVGKLKRVVKIELFENHLSGELPESLGNLTTLLQFDASENNFTGELPDRLAGLSLVSLNLNDNYMKGLIPKTLASNPNLVQLKLFNNYFSGNLPPDLGRNSDLADLDVSGNRFAGELPSNLCYRKKLQRLVVFNNPFSGNLPESYGECDSLNYVRIFNTELSGLVPTRFWSLPQIQFLELRNNRFEGSIPSTISGARELTHLLLSGNNISGSIPVQICGLQQLIALDIGQNQISGELPFCISKLKKLQKLDIHRNMVKGEISSQISSWTDLTELNLCKNRLSGKIPSELGNLPVLTYLDLSENSFSGAIPMELTKLKLNKFNISDNKLEGKVPPGFTHRLFLSSLLGNPDLCGPNLEPIPPCHKPHQTYVCMIAFLSVILLLLCGSVFWLVKNKMQVFRRKPKRPWKVTSFQRVEFNEEDILNSLTEENLIGSGSSGKVFRVRIKGGHTVAVKRLWRGDREPEMALVFKLEVDTLGKIRHGNILKLMFGCSCEELRILVYEYMENGSLANLLHGEKGGFILDWPKRFRIAVGAAQGLAYLHHGCVPVIVHRDVKPQNILLDNEFCPRIADFGLAKTLNSNDGQGDGVVSQVAGSYGYLAPEYAYTLKVTEKHDVYSYGVVLMELVSGKRPNDCSFGENRNIVKWVTEAALSSPKQKTEIDGSYFGSKLYQLIDPRMDPVTCNYEEIEKVLSVALRCTSNFPMTRPTMRRVVELLKDNTLASPN